MTAKLISNGSTIYVDSCTSTKPFPFIEVDHRHIGDNEMAIGVVGGKMGQVNLVSGY